MPGDKLPIPQFAAKIKAKYPQYAGMDDNELVQKIVAKYPDYAESVDMGSGVKKKVGGGNSGSDMASAAPSTDWTKRTTGDVKPNIQPQDNEAFDENDPVKSLMHPVRQKLDKATSAFQPLQQNEFFRSGESTVQRGQLPNKINSDKWNEFSQKHQDQQKAQMDLANTQNYVEQNAFKSGADAGAYLQKVAQKNGGQLPQDNETVQLAEQKHQQYQDLTRNIEQHGSITMAAISDYKKDHPDFAKQIGQVAKENYGAEEIPPAMEGRIVADYMIKHGSDLQAYADSHPDDKADYEDLQQNLFKRYPEFGANVVANEISRKRQELGMNSKIANFNTQGFNDQTDQLAADLYKNDPQKKAIYDQYIKDNKKQYIDTPSFLNAFEASGERTLKGMAGSLRDITPGSSTTGDDIYGELNKESNHVSAGATGLHGGLTTAGDFAGMIATMAGAGSLLKGAGMTPAIADKAVTGLSFYDDQLKQGEMKYADEPWKARLSGALNTAAFMSLSNIFPQAKVAQAFEKVKPEVENVIQHLNPENLAAAKQPLTQAFEKAIGQYGKGIGEMAGLTMFNQVLDKTLGMDQKTYDQYHPESELGDVMKTMAIGNALPSLLIGGAEGAGARNRAINDISEMADNPKRFSNLLNDLRSTHPEMAADIDKKLENLQFITDAKAQIEKENPDASEGQVKKMLFNKLAEKENIPPQTSNANQKDISLPTENKDNGKGIHQQLLQTEEQRNSNAGENAEAIPDVADGVRAANENDKGSSENLRQAEEPASHTIIEPKNTTNEINPIQEGQEANKPDVPNTEGQQPENPTPDQPIGEGQGGEPPAQKEQAAAGVEENPDKTGIKNTVSENIRESYGLPKVDLPKIGTDRERITEGKRLVDSGEINPTEVVDKIIKGDGKIGMQPDEAKAMLYYMHQLKGHEADLRAQKAAAETPEEEAAVNQKLQLLSDLTDAATRANMMAGTPWSDVGHTRQVQVDEGFNPSREKQLIKEAYGGEMPKEAQQRIDAALKERDDAIAQKDKAEEALKQQLAKGKAEEMKKSKRQKSDFKGRREDLREQLKQAKEEHEQWLKDNGIQKQGGGFVLTGKMIKIIGDLAKTYVDEGLEKLEDIIDKVHEEVKDYLTGISKKDIRDAIALHEAERVNKGAERREEKLATNKTEDYLKKPKPTFDFNKSTEWVKANQRLSNAENKIKQEKRKAFESQKNFYQKSLMWAGRLVRISILSGYNVLTKLAAAATIGGAVKRIPEQAIGKIYSIAFKGVAQKAPIEGYHAGLDAELKWYKEFFNPKKFVRNALQILKTGESDLSRKMGKGEYEHIPLLYLPTDLHQIIKDPVKRATFEASLKNGLAWAHQNGLDIHDPLVIQSVETAAFKRANYEIFQESNKLSQAFTTWKARMETKGNAGATAKLVADFMIPVSTVPTNIVRRLVSTSPAGLVRGVGKLTAAYRNGLEKLSEEEADVVMRQLKQGTLGTALWMAGWLGYSQFGGLFTKYAPNKKRDGSDMTSDEMMVDGKMIPKPVQHALPLEILQFAATARRVYENYRENKGDSPLESAVTSGMASIGALSEQIPVVATAGLALEATQDPYYKKKLGEDLQRRVEPQILRETGVVGHKNDKLKTLQEKYSDSDKIFKNDLKAYDKKGQPREISNQEFSDYKQKRDDLIKSDIEKFYQNGINGKKFDELTDDEVRDEITYIKRHATDNLKDEMFGQEKKTHAQKVAESHLEKARKKLYK